MKNTAATSSDGKSPLLFENCWATRFVEGVRSGGGELVAAGYIPMDAVVASLDATDAA